MLRNIFIYLLFALCSSVTITFAAEPKQVTSKIKEITVYQRGASVTRTAQTFFQAGTGEIVFIGLSNQIDASTIEVQGNSNATILSVHYQDNYLKQQEKSYDLQRLQNLLDTAQLRLNKLKNEQYALDEELKLLQENRKLTPTDRSIFVEDLEDLADFHRRRVQDVKNRMLRVAEQTTLAQINVSNLQQQLNQYQALHKTPSGEIVVTVQAAFSAAAEMTIRYFVTNAGWTPTYSLRANKLTDPVRLDYDANVYQLTGEEWKNVKLTLSTSNPALGGNKPELNTWYLSTQVPRIENRKPVRPTADDNFRTDSYSTESELKMENAADYTSVAENALNVSFEINLHYDIASNGQPKLVRIQQFELPAEFIYVAVPKIDGDAFLQAKVHSWEDLNLLPGPANLYLERAYVGKSYIDPRTAGDTLELSFGRDRQIFLTRTKVKDFSKKQWLGNSIKQNFAYEITVKNTKSANATIFIEDQVPVSMNKEIEVGLVDVGGASYDAQTGKLSWKIILQPNESKILRLVYQVKYPKNQIISNLY